jgi:hypothetical protein
LFLGGALLVGALAALVVLLLRSNGTASVTTDARASARPSERPATTRPSFPVIVLPSIAIPSLALPTLPHRSVVTANLTASGDYSGRMKGTAPDSLTTFCQMGRTGGGTAFADAVFAASEDFGSTDKIWRFYFTDPDGPGRSKGTGVLTTSIGFNDEFYYWEQDDTTVFKSPGKVTYSKDFMTITVDMTFTSDRGRVRVKGTVACPKES